MLILLKQLGTGVYFESPEIPDNEVFQVWYFDTEVKETYFDNVIGGSNFELAIGADVWIDPDTSDRYFYIGNGEVDVDEGDGPILPPTYLLRLITNPLAKGAFSITGETSPFNFEAGQVAEITVTPSEGYSFVRWEWNNVQISDQATFNYTMPAANIILIAILELTVPIEPDPDPIPDPVPADFVVNAYYPLEIRLFGAQVPIKGLTTKIFTNIFNDEFEGDYSFPITFPISPEVRVAMRMPEDPQSSWDYSEPIPAELWADGNRRYPGHLDVSDANEDNVKAVFVLDSGFFIQRNKTLSIRDCYANDDTILLDQPVSALGGHSIRITNRNSYTLTVNDSFSRLFPRAQFDSHILMLEAIADYLESLPLNLEIKIDYSEDLTDTRSRIIAWDTNIVTRILLLRTTTTVAPGVDAYNNSRINSARRITIPRLEMGVFNTPNEANRIAFPTVYNRSLYEGNNPLHDGIVNRYDSGGRLIAGNINYYSFSESIRWENTIVPYLYLTDVVKRIFAFLKIQVSGEFFDDPRVKKMLLYNNRTLDFIQVLSLETGSPERRTALAIIRGDLNPEQVDFIYLNTLDLNIKLKNHVPDIKVPEFLKAMKNYFNLKYDFNILQNRVEIRFVKSIIRDMEVIDMTEKASRVYTLTHGKEKGIAFVYEDKDPLLEDGNRRINPADADFQVNNFLAIDALDAEIEQIAYVRSLRAFFKLTTAQEEPPFWKLHAFVMADDEVSNSDGKDQKRTWSVKMVPLVDAYFDGKKVPAIEMTGNNPEVNLDNEETGIRIFAFYGRQTDANNKPYAFASCTKYNSKELASADQFDLDLRSEDSYPFWKDLESMIDRAKEYECTLILDDADITNLSRSRKIRIGNIDYLIDEMEIANTQGEHAIGKVKMYKIKS
ncbi:InlB B-repeat-containing protein [Belliella pelovolcani]|uniref:InlB B-repeat-containing protein n=1 Tax=Belliella pelovolcani TaxID=529505 RepID=UPI00391C5FBE